MRKRTVGTKVIAAKLEELIAIEGGIRPASRSLGLSETYLRDVLAERREPGPKLIAALGFTRKVRKTVIYKEKRGEHENQL